jgi:hypothetical protein
MIARRTSAHFRGEDPKMKKLLLTAAMVAILPVAASATEPAREACCKHFGGTYRPTPQGFGGEKRCFDMGPAVPNDFFKCVIAGGPSRAQSNTRR